MKILAIIPARGGSKGVPRKNIKLLNGKPLLQYTFEAAKNSKLLTDIILTSEDSEIIEIANKMGLKAPFIRPHELATDAAASIDVVLHAIDYMENQGFFYDAVCLLQPSSPFRESGFIDKAIEKFISQKSDSMLSVLAVPHEFNPHWVFEQDKEGNLKIATGEKEIIKRRQDLPSAFYRDGSVYITKIEVLKNQKSFYGNSIGYIESDSNYSCNIDTMSDWDLAEKKALELNNK